MGAVDTIVHHPQTSFTHFQVETAALLLRFRQRRGEIQIVKDLQRNSSSTGSSTGQQLQQHCSSVSDDDIYDDGGGDIDEAATECAGDLVAQIGGERQESGAIAQQFVVGDEEAQGIDVVADEDDDHGRIDGGLEAEQPRQ